MKTSLFFTALIFTSYLVFSQNSPGSINGIIIDKNSKTPIEAADVTLYKAGDSTLVKGTSSDKDGKFSFADIPFGEYRIKANLVGYSFANVKGIVLNQNKPVLALEPIHLSHGTATTEEILVESEKSSIQFDGDKKIFDVTKNPMSESGSAADLLKNIPSVTVDADGNISLRGNSNVKILVDGRPFGLEGQNRANLLEQIPANQIQNIELITNPSSKYEAEGVSGIINIVLKKNKMFGYNGNLTLNAGSRDKYSGSFGLNLKNEKVQLFGNYNYNINNFFVTGISDRTNSLSTSEYLLTQDNEIKVKMKSHFVKGGLDYFINQQNTIGLSMNFQHSGRLRGEFITTREFDINNNLTSHFTRDYDADITNRNYDIALNYTKKFRNPKQSLTGDVIYTFSENNEDGFTLGSDIYQPTNNPDQIKELSKIKDRDLSVQSDYIQPFGEESKLETGFKSRYRLKQNDYQNQYYDYNVNGYVFDPNLTNNFEYSDLINAFYATYTGSLSIFKFQAGARIEQTSARSRLTTETDETKSNYTDIFPSGNISTNLTKSTELQVSYSRRIRRPSLWELNPFINTSDPNNYYSGNPNLRPEYTDSYELSVIQFMPGMSITPSLFYNRTRDLISRTRNFIDSNTTLTSMVNYANSTAYGIDLIFNAQPFKFWSFNGSVSYFKTDVDATNINSTYVNEGSTWSGRISSSLYLPAEFSLQLNYFYSGDILAAQATVEPFHSLDASLKKDFFEGRLSATLRVSDVFNTLRFRVNINNDVNYSEIFQRKRDTRVVNLGISYKFGEADKNQNKRRRDSNRENQGNDGFGF